MTGLSGDVRGFSVDMKSKAHVKSISVSDEAHDRVFFEGHLGELEQVSVIEGVALEIRGSYGVLRIDLSEEELREALKKSRASLT
jgi:hypothetical protein